jgi:hypothetical protein
MPFDPRQHLINLRGKDYLPVAARLVWLNEDSHRYTIQTNILKLEDTFAIVQATVTVFDEVGNPIKTGSATKREDKTHFPDYLEKAETGAIGRALGMLGFGTQFAPEFDELTGQLEARVVDSPQPTPQPAPRAEAARAEPVPAAKAQSVARSEPAAVAPSVAKPALSSIPLKPASALSAPTNARKPKPEPELEETPVARASAPAMPDIDDGLEEYDHSAVSDEDLFSDAKVQRLMAIGGKLFNLKGDPLEHRLLEASSKILKKSVSDIHALHWRDGGEVMRQLEEQAIKRGVWERKA